MAAASETKISSPRRAISTSSDGPMTACGTESTTFSPAVSDEAHRRPLPGRQRGDDPKTVLGDGVVGDSGGVAEHDRSGLHRAQSLAGCGLCGCQDNDQY